MAKEPKNKTTVDKSSTEIIKEEVKKLEDSENNETAETMLNEDTQPVVVKKSSGGLSLLISLLALAGVVYLYYKDWMDVDNSLSTAVIQQLQDSDQVLSTDIQRAQVDINRVKQQTTQLTAVEQQLKQLSEQFVGLNNNQQNTSQNSAGNNNQFDNSNNETALAELQQRVNDQAKAINGLKTTSSADVTQGTAHDVLSDNYAQIEKNAAIQVLLTTDVLLSTHRLIPAIAALDNYLKVSGLKPVDKNKMLRLLNQLQQIDQPDLAEIDQQLQALKSTVDAMQVTTLAATNDEPKWYERFVSVKKIATESSISSTAQMVAFKTELNRLLYQAKLYLILNDQAGWQSSLNAAAKWAKDDMPDNDELITRIMGLANQTVVAVIPSQLDVAAVIDELNGLR